MVQVEWHDQVDYATALTWQKTWVAERNTTPGLDDKLLLLQHPPAYTLGTRGNIKHLLVDKSYLAKHGIQIHHVGRGGDITYHGPGQLVGYPILNLKRLHQAQGYPRPDLHLYVRQIEEVLIQALVTFGVSGWRYNGYTGVWVDTAAGPRKIAAIGVRVSVKGISSHGFALNVMPNMRHFDNIVPCGIEKHGVTSLSTLLQRPLAVTKLLIPLINAFQNVFQVQTTEIRSNLCL